MGCGELVSQEKTFYQRGKLRSASCKAATALEQQPTPPCSSQTITPVLPCPGPVLFCRCRSVRFSLADPWMHAKLDDGYPLVYMRSNAARIPHGLVLNWLFR